MEHAVIIIVFSFQEPLFANLVFEQSQNVKCEDSPWVLSVLELQSIVPIDIFFLLCQIKAYNKTTKNCEHLKIYAFFWILKYSLGILIVLM